MNKSCLELNVDQGLGFAMGYTRYISKYCCAGSTVFFRVEVDSHQLFQEGCSFPKPSAILHDCWKEQVSVWFKVRLAQHQLVFPERFFAKSRKASNFLHKGSFMQMRNGWAPKLLGVAFDWGPCGHNSHEVDVHQPC